MATFCFFAAVIFVDPLPCLITHVWKMLHGFITERPEGNILQFVCELTYVQRPVTNQQALRQVTKVVTDRDARFFLAQWIAE